MTDFPMADHSFGVIHDEIGRITAVVFSTLPSAFVGHPWALQLDGTYYPFEQQKEFLERRYVVDGGIVVRPEFPIAYSITPAGEALFSGIPNGTKITISPVALDNAPLFGMAESYADGDDVEIAVEALGTYKISLELFPYQDYSVTLRLGE